MKKALYILLAALPLLAGCDLNEYSIGGIGTPIKFTANTYYENGPGTKTDYSGEFFGSSPRYERIDWVDGDLMHIWAEVDGTNTANENYEVTSHSAYQQDSNAEIEASGSGINWLSQTEQHTFYAMYPAPSIHHDGEKVALARNVIKATVPAAQTVSAPQNVTVNNVTRRVSKPNMDFAFMWAATRADVGAEVNLAFKPLVTAFEITVGAEGTGTAKQLASFSLEATDPTNGPYIAGDFVATINNSLTGYTYSLTDNSSKSKSITVNLGNVTVTHDNPITFTLFALPQTMSGLKMVFNFTGGGGKSVELNNDGAPVTFDAAKKYRISNVYIPEGETWTYKIDEISPIITYGHRAVTSGLNFNVKSYKESSLGNVAAVPWEIQYSLDGTNWVDAATWTDNRFAVNSTSGIGSTTTGETNGARILRDHNSTEKDRQGFDSEEAAIAVFRSRGVLPSSISDAGDGYFDLSKHSFRVSADGSVDEVDSSEEPMETANCYIITRPGKYKFPLVYGNAIRNGADNQKAYAPQGLTATNDINYYLRRFLNHADQPIVDPWLKNNGATPTDAVVVWQDVASADLQILLDSDISVDANYVYFEIKSERIRPGNILLAARQNGTIVWSWHIWVTEKDLAPQVVKDKTGVSHDMMKYNLGWTDKTSAWGEKWFDWPFYVKVVQKENGAATGVERVFLVKQIGESISVDANVGSNCFYQWGRKDPILPATTTGGESTSVNKHFYSAVYSASDIVESNVKVKTVQNNSGTFGQSIKTPYNIFFSRGNYLYVGRAAGTSQQAYYGNLWSVDQINHTDVPPGGNALSVNNHLPIKSVYDPSPRGYVVPYTFAFTGFSNQTWNTNNPGTVNGSATTDGINFNDGNGGKIYFPYAGARGGDGISPLYDITNTMYYWTTGKLPVNGSSATKSKNLTCLGMSDIRAIWDQYSEGAYAIRSVRQVEF